MVDRAVPAAVPEVHTTLVHAHGIAALVALLVSVAFGVVASLQLLYPDFSGGVPWLSQPRPEMPNLEKNYPDRALKPIDNGYGPYADTFSQGQHKYGPFKPIDDYYKSLKKPGR